MVDINIYIYMSMKYKRGIPMIFDIPWLFLSENVVYCFIPLYQFFEDHNQGCPLREVKQFFKCSFP